MAHDDYADYAAWLHQDISWPTGNRFAHDRAELISIDGMAPQYAASALAKMLRWAYSEGYPRLNIHDADERVLHVRRSSLGVALAARALGLYNLEGMGSCYGPIYPPLREITREAMDPKRAAMLVLTHIVRHDPDLSIGQMADLAEDIVAGLTGDGYKVLSP